MPRGGSKPGERRGGRKKGTPNKLTAKLQAPLAKAAQQYDGNALQTLVAIMNDDTATTAARVAAPNSSSNVLKMLVAQHPAHPRLFRDK
jgi:hypothetical protein